MQLMKNRVFQERMRLERSYREKPSRFFPFLRKTLKLKKCFITRFFQDGGHDIVAQGFAAGRGKYERLSLPDKPGFFILGRQHDRKSID